MRALTFDEALRVRNMRAVELWALANDVQGTSGLLVTPDALREMALDIVCDALATSEARAQALAEALETARRVIHDELCGRPDGHHEGCVEARAALAISQAEVERLKKPDGVVTFMAPDYVQVMVNNARAEAQEACAKLVEHRRDTYPHKSCCEWYVLDNLAAALRARGKGGE